MKNQHGTSIDELLRQCGPWYVLIRAHDSLWRPDAKHWPFPARLEATKDLLRLAREVPDVNKPVNAH